MDSPQSLGECGTAEIMLEALIRYGIVQEDEITRSADSIVNVDSLWNLFKKCESKCDEATEKQSKELLEVQKYVENLRSLSGERDNLNEEFERENEKLKSELKSFKEKAVIEAEELSTMCRQEDLHELVGSSFSEQMAYLLVVRATLLDKLEALKDDYSGVVQQRDQLDARLKELAAEDGEMRSRMEVAMGEMGGMASKLNDALQERDALRKETCDLKKALESIQSLPSLNEAKSQLAAQQLDLQRQQSFYSEEMERLRAKLEESEKSRGGERAELSLQVEELQEANARLKDVNRRLNDELARGQEGAPCRVGADPHKIIEEMQLALEEDEARSREQQESYEKVIAQLKMRVHQLEVDNNNQNNESIVPVDFPRLSAELSELRSQNDKLQERIATMASDLDGSRQKLVKRDASHASMSARLERQTRHVTDLKGRNGDLEAQLAKVLSELREAINNRGARGSSGEAADEVARRKAKVADMEEAVFLETSGGFPEDVLQLKREMDKDREARADLEERVTSSELRLSAAVEARARAEAEVRGLEERAAAAEAQILLLSGKQDDNQTQKLLLDLDRAQLEAAVEMMTRRADFLSCQLRSCSDRYKNLKQKHRTKIRRIRELFLLERKTTSEEIERLERRARSAEASLERELSWKEEAAGEVRAAEQGRREAIRRADVAVLEVEERTERINRLSNCRDDLRSENATLQKQLTLLEKQKAELEQMVLAAERKQQKQELTTLLSSLSMSGDLNNNPPPEDPQSEDPQSEDPPIPMKRAHK